MFRRIGAHIIAVSVVCAALAQGVLAQPVLRPGGSVDVLYSFPGDPSDRSVGRNGELNFALRMPRFPAVLSPEIYPVYNSRGGDGVMGMGWSLAVPSLHLDLTTRKDLIDVTAARMAEELDGNQMGPHNQADHAVVAYYRSGSGWELGRIEIS